MDIEQVYILGRTFEVKYCEDSPLELSCYGRCVNAKQQLWVMSGVHPEQEQETLLHEMVHAGDHLVLGAEREWRAVEPALYAKLREVEWLEIESGGEKRRIRMGAVPSIEIECVTPGALLWTVQGALSVTPVRVRESDPEQELIGLWTDVGAYVVQGGLVVDGFPQW